MLLLMMITAGCAKTSSSTVAQNQEAKEMKMNVKIDEYNFTAALEDNVATAELVKLLKQSPITINMSDYSGFEKVGELGRTLPSANSRITTRPGDIVLYNSNNLVMFYGNNTWSYTMLGHVDNLENWTQALGSGDVKVELSIIK